MENAKELLSNVTERIKNPLIFSFLCSWVVFNWPIAVAFLWYGSEGIEKVNHTNLFEYIKSYSAAYYYHLFLLPLLAAIIYTGAMPVIN